MNIFCFEHIKFNNLAISPSSRLAFFALFLIITANFAAIPTAEARYSAIVIEAETGQILYARNADTKRYPASLTKMMTLYLAFDALDSLALAIAAMAGMVDDMEPVPDAMRAAADQGYATATDLADWLVRVLKLPFREAHHVTGRIVAEAESQSLPLEKLSLKAMQAVERRITNDVFSVLSPEKSVSSRKSYGGTAPQNVRKMARSWLKRLEKGLARG